MSKPDHHGLIAHAIHSVLPELESAIAQLLAGGATVDQTVDTVAAIVDHADDAIVAQIPAPVGGIVEAVDGPLLHLVLRGIVHAVRRRVRGGPAASVPAAAPAPNAS